MGEPKEAPRGWIARALRFAKSAAMSNRAVYLLCRGVLALVRRGPAYALEKLTYFLRVTRATTGAYRVSARERAAQRARVFDPGVKISILTPLYNTDLRQLRAMVESVLNQTYADWELCLADGSDGKHGYVREIALAFAKKDARVVYKKLDNNEGIAGNTNRAFEMATGEFIALLDHDDILHPAALYEVMLAIERGADMVYTDEIKFSGSPSKAYAPHYKPDFAPDTLRSGNYICHFTVFSRALLRGEEPVSGEYNGSQDFDLVLRLTERARRIVHIPKLLYFWRVHPQSTAMNAEVKPYAYESARKAILAHLKRIGLPGDVEIMRKTWTYRTRYALQGQPLISVIIPNKDQPDVLRTCVRSILEKTAYPNYEILIIENNSREAETAACYKELTADPRVRVCVWDKPFNYSAINNFGASKAGGDVLLLLNNDTEVVTPAWMEEMLMYAQRPDVGAVGAKLYYPNGTIQHAGVILGIGGVAGHPFHRFSDREHGYAARLRTVQNLSAVTAACLMVRKEAFQAVGGLDPELAVAFNDVDFCLRLRARGLLNVFTPFAELVHHESLSRGYEDTPEKTARFNREAELMKARWARELAAGDPYYNLNLTLLREDFTPRGPFEW